MLNILIACDHKISRGHLQRVLSESSLFAVSICADVYAAIAISERQQPHIVLMDGSSDPLAAIEATKKIVSCSAANVIAFSRQADEGFARHMMAAGALGYITAPSVDAEIVKAVEEVAKDNVYNCLETPQAPLATPRETASLRESFASFSRQTRQRMQAASEVHWHAILQFTN